MLTVLDLSNDRGGSGLEAKHAGLVGVTAAWDRCPGNVAGYYYDLASPKAVRADIQRSAGLPSVLWLEGQVRCCRGRERMLLPHDADETTAHAVGFNINGLIAQFCEVAGDGLRVVVVLPRPGIQGQIQQDLAEEWSHIGDDLGARLVVVTHSGFAPDDVAGRNTFADAVCDAMAWAQPDTLIDELIKRRVVANTSRDCAAPASCLASEFPTGYGYMALSRLARGEVVRR